MAGICGLHGIHRKSADGVGELGMIDVCGGCCFRQNEIFILAGANSRRRGLAKVFQDRMQKSTPDIRGARDSQTFSDTERAQCIRPDDGFKPL
tara:strand:+ start:2971 stop:3249 length:279 start_codon:yes stop_codon:yes gene_type:complete